MTTYTATCPTHGQTEAVVLRGHGWRCMADDEDRPEGICGRECSEPVDAASGTRITKGKPPHYWAGEKFTKGRRT